MEEKVAEGLSLIKHLSSCNKTTRERSLDRLNNWLSSQSEISDGDMNKLWKCLFYCVWHADKVDVQSELINRISSIPISLNFSLSVNFFSVFLLTMRREWSGIDGPRLDKFYLLIRGFLHSVFLLLKKNSWELEILQRFMGVLEEKSFFADDEFNGNGNGVNYHIASVFLEELLPFLPVRVETVDALLKPFISVMGKSQDKVFVGKVKCCIFDVFLKMGKCLLERKKSGGSVECSGDETELFGAIALTMNFSTMFYDLGSSSDCIKGNRKFLFSLHEEFLKLENDLRSSGIGISVPEVEVNDDNGVSKLIPIVSTETELGSSEFVSLTTEVSVEGLNASTSKLSKKKKKKFKKGKNKSNIMNKEKENELAVDIAESSCTKEFASDGVISNIQMQFENVADEDGKCSSESPKVNVISTVSKKSKKRKRVKASTGKDPCELSASGEKSVKRVRFSMKNNLVWKPHTPLPPQSLRLPASATPRGSALKKGLLPGPIREMPPATKKVRRKKRAQKGIKAKAPAVKRLRKLQGMAIL